MWNLSPKYQWIRRGLDRKHAEGELLQTLQELFCFEESPELVFAGLKVSDMMDWKQEAILFFSTRNCWELCTQFTSVRKTVGTIKHISMFLQWLTLQRLYICALQVLMGQKIFRFDVIRSYQPSTDRRVREMPMSSGCCPSISNLTESLGKTFTALGSGFELYQ